MIPSATPAISTEVALIAASFLITDNSTMENVKPYPAISKLEAELLLHVLNHALPALLILNAIPVGTMK